MRKCIIELAEGLVQQHTTVATTKDFRLRAREALQHAFDLGVAEAGGPTEPVVNLAKDPKPPGPRERTRLAKEAEEKKKAEAKALKRSETPPKAEASQKEDAQKALDSF
jgi:hypothetical protein